MAKEKQDNKSRMFSGKKYWLKYEGLSKKDAEFWKNDYKNRGYLVRVVLGKYITDKYKYSLYVR